MSKCLGTLRSRGLRGVAQPEAGTKRCPGGRTWQGGTRVISGAVLGAVTPASSAAVHLCLPPAHPRPHPCPRLSARPRAGCRCLPPEAVPAREVSGSGCGDVATSSACVSVRAFWLLFGLLDGERLRIPNVNRIYRYHLLLTVPEFFCSVRECSRLRLSGSAAVRASFPSFPVLSPFPPLVPGGLCPVGVLPSVARSAGIPAVCGLHPWRCERQEEGAARPCSLPVPARRSVIPGMAAGMGPAKWGLPRKRPRSAQPEAPSAVRPSLRLSVHLPGSRWGVLGLCRSC